jgi:hypothetical protein
VQKTAVQKTEAEGPHHHAYCECLGTRALQLERGLALCLLDDSSANPLLRARDRSIRQTVQLMIKGCIALQLLV